MKRAIAPLILLLFVLAGCEIEKDPVYEPLDPSLHLTDGFCLLKNSRVVLNHYDIDYYDYSAHLIYLKDPGAFEEKFIGPGSGAICADSTGQGPERSVLTAHGSMILPSFLMPLLIFRRDRLSGGLSSFTRMILYISIRPGKQWQ